VIFYAALAIALPFATFGIHVQCRHLFGSFNSEVSLFQILRCIMVIDPMIQCLFLIFKALTLLFVNSKRGSNYAYEKKRHCYALLEEYSYCCRLVVNSFFWICFYNVRVFLSLSCSL